MNTPVSFEIAKLLKEKDFDEPCRFVHDNWNNIEDWYDIGGVYHRNSEKNASVYYSAPTIAEVVMWLYQKHGIWIQAPFSHNDIKPFCWIITTTKRNISEEDEDKNCWLSGIDNDNIEGYNSPTEAYEAAIKYCLEKTVASKSAEITEQIAIEFGNFLFSKGIEYYDDLANGVNYIVENKEGTFTMKDLFQEFLITKQ